MFGPQPETPGQPAPQQNRTTRTFILEEVPSGTYHYNVDQRCFKNGREAAQGSRVEIDPAGLKAYGAGKKMDESATYRVLRVNEVQDSRLEAPALEPVQLPVRPGTNQPPAVVPPAAVVTGPEPAGSHPSISGQIVEPAAAIVAGPEAVGGEPNGPKLAVEARRFTLEQLPGGTIHNNVDERCFRDGAAAGQGARLEVDPEGLKVFGAGIKLDESARYRVMRIQEPPARPAAEQPVEEMPASPVPMGETRAAVPLPPPPASFPAASQPLPSARPEAAPLPAGSQPAVEHRRFIVEQLPIGTQFRDIDERCFIDGTNAARGSRVKIDPEGLRSFGAGRNLDPGAEYRVSLVIDPSQTDAAAGPQPQIKLPDSFPIPPAVPIFPSPVGPMFPMGPMGWYDSYWPYLPPTPEGIEMLKRELPRAVENLHDAANKAREGMHRLATDGQEQPPAGRAGEPPAKPEAAPPPAPKPDQKPEP